MQLPTLQLCSVGMLGGAILRRVSMGRHAKNWNRSNAEHTPSVQGLSPRWNFLRTFPAWLFVKGVYTAFVLDYSASAFLVRPLADARVYRGVGLPRTRLSASEA